LSISPDSTPVLILGGGVAGLAAALDLARRGLASTLVEAEPSLGGRARDFCCKAVEACARCGACRLADLLAEPAQHPEIKVYTQAMALAARPGQGELAGGWQVDLSPQGLGESAAPGPGQALSQRLTIEAQAVIIAVGHTPFDPSKKSSLGYGRVDGVISALELEAMLACGAFEQQPVPQRVAFIQCVGSRDASLGRLWCSRVCCGYALRMARMLKADSPDSEVSFFHMDVQEYGRAWEQELEQLREQIRFVRAMPGEVAAGQQGPEVVFADASGVGKREAFGLVVLSQGLGPPASAKALSEIFGLARTQDGFLGSQEDQVASGAAGVFVAGACRGPRSLTESIDHAGLAASKAAGHVASLNQGASRG
jgi:heterodisulfide reductase subunit A2